MPFQADGLVGSYIIDVPPAAVAGTPIPLVLDLHGYAERANVEVLESGLPAFGEKAGFVTVTPEITRPVPLWKIQLNSPDTPFIAALLDHLEATMCIDTNRVFAAGLSDGAFMTSILACDLSDRIAAAAPVAGILAPTGCAPKRAVPVVTFHGTADPFVSYDGGLGAGVETLPKPDGSGVIGSIPLSSVPIPNLVSVPTRAATWATRNGCTSETPGATTIAADVTLFSYDCPTGHEVQLYRIEGGGHSWPGSAFSKSIVAIVGPTTFSIDADTIIWQFFLDHPL